MLLTPRLDLHQLEYHTAHWKGPRRYHLLESRRTGIETLNIGSTEELCRNYGLGSDRLRTGRTGDTAHFDKSHSSRTQRRHQW